jgi:hypothetical protein
MKILAISQGFLLDLLDIAHNGGAPRQHVKVPFVGYGKCVIPVNCEAFLDFARTINVGGNSGKANHSDSLLQGKADFNISGAHGSFESGRIFDSS